MRYHHFFWDYDGTLFDSYDAVTRSFARGLDDLGIRIPWQEAYDLCKIALDVAAEKLGARFGVDPADILEGYRRHKPEQTFGDIRPYPHARETLAALARAGGRHYLYTHRDGAALASIRHYGMDGLFTDAITSQDGFARKPAPDALLFLLRKHALSPDDCVMIGDRDIDVESGVNAGMAGALFDPGDYYPRVVTPIRCRDMDELLAALL